MYIYISALVMSTYPKSPQHTAAHCNTLQHSATPCNTLQHTATVCRVDSSSNVDAPQGAQALETPQLHYPCPGNYNIIQNFIYK